MGGEEPAPEQALALEGVGVSIGGRAILSEVGFSLGRGEFCGLIGANGSGKTTLLRTILGLHAPSAGRIRVGGRQARLGGGLGGVGGAGGVGYVPQKAFVDPNLPVRARDLVGLGYDGHRFGIPFGSAERRRRVAAAIEAVEAEGFADRRMGDLSGGQQQRVLIAHALARRPGLLLLDEPLASLDVRSVAGIVALLRRLSADEGVTVLMSSHDVNPLLPAMDRVVYLAAGRAVSGRAEEVIRTEVLSALYGHHVDVLRVHGRLLVVSGGGGAEDEAHLAHDAVHAETVP